MNKAEEKRRAFGKQLRDAATARNQSITGIFVFVLLGLFAIMSTLMVLLSAQMYRSTVSVADQTGEFRIQLSYLRSMVRGMDSTDNVRVDTWTDEESGESIPMVVFVEDYDGDEYLTQVYVYNGQLMERFTEAIYAFDPEDGETICRADSMQAAMENGLLLVRLELDGQAHDVCMALRSE